ncbi:hypothetical protein Tco_0619546, partial [Tanacetum coccineum]
VIRKLPEEEKGMFLIRANGFSSLMAWPTKVVGWNHTPMFENGLIEACLLLQVMELGCGSSQLCNDRLISKGIKAMSDLLIAFMLVPDLSVEDYISATASKHTIYMRRITVRVKEIRTWSIHISNDIESIDSTEGQDVDECRSFNENVNPIEAFDDFIQQTEEEKEHTSWLWEYSIPPGFGKEHIINEVAPSRERKEGDASVDPQLLMMTSYLMRLPQTTLNPLVLKISLRRIKIVLNHPTPHELASVPPPLSITVEKN